MPLFHVHEHATCDVIFVRRVEAKNAEHALKVDAAESGELLGVAVGDMEDAFQGGAYPAETAKLPACFYPEPAAFTALTKREENMLAALRAALETASIDADDGALALKALSTLRSDLRTAIAEAESQSPSPATA